MRPLAKAYAIVLIAFFLGSQLIAARPSWAMPYWPFTSYPMYSTARYSTDDVRENRLLGVPCDTTSPAHALAPDDMGMTEYQAQGLLRLVADTLSRFAASPTRRANLAEDLRNRVLVRYGSIYCSLEISERVHRNDGSSRSRDTPPWNRARIVGLDGGGPP